MVSRGDSLLMAGLGGLTSSLQLFHTEFEIVCPRQVAKDSNYNNIGNKYRNITYSPEVGAA